MTKHNKLLTALMLGAAAFMAVGPTLADEIYVCESRSQHPVSYNALNIHPEQKAVDAAEHMTSADADSGDENHHTYKINVTMSVNQATNAFGHYVQENFLISAAWIDHDGLEVSFWHNFNDQPLMFKRRHGQNNAEVFDCIRVHSDLH